MMPLVEQLGALVLRRGATGGVVGACQDALRSAGHDLVIDGKFGRNTELAVKMFQATRGLTVDGRIGPNTARALDIVVVANPPAVVPPASPSVLATIPHLSIMRALKGTAEIPGPKSNPLILGWRDEIIERFPRLKPHLSWYQNDDTPWCGLAVAYAIAMAGFCPPDGPLAAVNWMKFGIEIPDPIPGAIMVFRRPGGHHVAFSETVDQRAYHCLGGNQGNKVSVAPISRERRLLGIRWPAELPIPVGAKPIMIEATDYKMSSNEA